MFRMNFAMISVCLLQGRQFTYFYFTLLISVCYTVTATVMTTWLFIGMLLNYLVRRNTAAELSKTLADKEAQNEKLPKAPFLLRHFFILLDGIFCICTFVAFSFLVRTTNDAEFARLIFDNPWVKLLCHVSFKHMLPTRLSFSKILWLPQMKACFILTG